VDAVLNWLWQGAVVAGVTAALLQLLDRTRAAVRCLVCWVALLAVVLLPLLSLGPAAGAPIEPTASTAAAAITVPGAWWTSFTFIAGLWVLWLAVSTARLGRAVIVVRRAKAGCRAFPAAVCSSLPHWQRVRQTGRPVQLALSDRVSAAAVFGCGKPVIAVAPTLVARLDADELDRIVIHEWAHVQRRDDLTTIGQLIVRAIAGWHPAVWWLDRRLSIEQELACDETVVAVSGGAKSYASCLVKLASLRAGHPDVLLASGALSSSGLTRRVARLLFRPEFTSSAWGRAAAALGIALLVALALGVAPVRFVQAAVSASAVRVLHAVATTEPGRMAAVATAPIDDRLRMQNRRSAETPAVALRAGRSVEEPPVAVTTPPVRQLVLEAADQVRAVGAAPDAPGDAEPPVEPPGLPLVAFPFPVAATAPPLTAEPSSRSPWGSAADAGVAVGSASKRAGVATAGAFTRVAKKIAGSF
jgi:beta-lactamase regulating signal transducer with metallopeptidase domain